MKKKLHVAMSFMVLAAVSVVLAAGEGRLSCSSNKITDVYIKGRGDVGFVEASPAIEGSKLIVRHPGGKEPLCVRMGWNTNAIPNLMNKEGLPASPLRTDGQIARNK